MPPQGDFEANYGGPWTGLDYSKPANLIDQGALAPGSVNTSQMEGFLTSSPWVATKPYTTGFAVDEYTLGIFPYNYINGSTFPQNTVYGILIVTNKKVYRTTWASATNTPAPVLTLIHTWGVGEISIPYQAVGPIAFVEINSVIFFTGLILKGIFSYAPNTNTFATATVYVSAAHLVELGGRLVAAETRFPTGGGPSGNVGTPTVAWSGVGVYAGAGVTDPWDPVNNLGGGFNLLSDMPDQINGMFTMGRSAIITRKGGISQQDPNGNFSTSGIQPFIWYHLWSSPQGIGALSRTAAQYGDMIGFESSDNVYVMSISGGLAPIGDRINAKIKFERKKADFQGGIVNFNGGAGIINFETNWSFGSFVVIAGQLHYLLTYSATTVSYPSFTGQNYTNFVFDYNLSEKAWHVWDLSQYYLTGGLGAGFQAFSTPIVQILDTVQYGASAQWISLFSGFYFGAFTNFGTTGTGTLAGTFMQFVPVDYDFLTDNFSQSPLGAFVSNLVLSIPRTLIRFRVETVKLGAKITVRRIRFQLDQPSFTPNSVAQTVEGLLIGSTRNQTAPRTVVTPNTDQNLGPLQTYYLDALLTDDMVQGQIAASIQDSANPWASMCLLRMATASLIGVDTTGTRQ